MKIAGLDSQTVLEESLSGFSGLLTIDDLKLS